MTSYSPLLLSLAIVIAGFLAGISPFFFAWTHERAHPWLAFGAGTILGAATLHMLPEGYELSGFAGAPMIALGFVTLFAIETLALKHPHDEDTGQFHEVGLLAFIGLTFHDLIDGVTLGSGHHIPELTGTIFIALALHKIPTTFSLSLVMLHGGIRKKNIVKFLLVSLLAIPLGVALSRFLIDRLGADHERTIGYLIYFSAGTFFYIGGYELLPQMLRKSKTRLIHLSLFFILGVVVMLGLKLVHPIA